MISKKQVVRVIKKTVSILSRLIPKNDKKIIFKSRPDLSGNAKALSDFIISNHPNYKVIWIVEDDGKFNNISFDVIKTGTIKSLYHYFTSKYIVTTHNEMIGTKATSQIYISLWHGMPLKKICYLGEFDNVGMEDFSAHRIATSEVMRSIISACFREKANNVYITGQPRNDFLFQYQPLDFISTIPNTTKKKIIYAPTFRQNQKALKYSDGTPIVNNNFLRVIDFDIKLLDIFLETNNAELFIKLHPFEEETFISVELTKNITIIKTETLQTRNLDINHLLSNMDILITDYSSLYFDYMLLNRPICFLIPDIDIYGDSRGGFTLEPVNFWMPGAQTNSQQSLQDELKKLLNGQDDYQDQRDRINNVINFHKDGNSSARVFQQFFTL
ncbi:CDP-glycerol glycerophosphotransferase family protein [Yersinia pekkanenii]|uniref:CDP-glycerol:poly(Glycerophosphate) glycerophosphotransferase n=1 Tax=Yersinia pekkanenii TaxID=1288385 RepID=A0A0T9NJ44_9GAMM|nr:CDP-glycerol glycerophosphotransferase family protein [Yersinia pekkanenii]CNH13188.1 CDP-glycerol:poly(glycerophosphate) glycerophosphotransferase [Yersinia pekkanenii]CRY65443.1 CDP-glycerol:poly(glycerophosphate) glycerophosphotransferase [Yersinia pekkanenii]